MARTIENFVASIFRYGIEFIQGTARLVSERGQKLAATMLLTLAVGAATGAGPILAKLADAKWVAEAAKIMEAQLKKLADADK